MTAGAGVLPAAQDHPHAQHNRAGDEQEAQELQARRIIDPSGHHTGDTDSDGKGWQLAGGPPSRKHTAGSAVSVDLHH
jgi:hypothetical protein